MALDAVQARNIIEKELQSTRGEELAATTSFCQIWPKAKPILAAASTFIIILGPQAGAVLNGLIKIGDEVFGQACG